jgi:hypothetical protein
MPRLQEGASILQLRSELTSLEELLKDHQTGEGGQLLLFEFQGGETAGLTINVGVSYIHSGWPLFQVGSCSLTADPTL